MWGRQTSSLSPLAFLCHFYFELPLPPRFLQTRKFFLFSIFFLLLKVRHKKSNNKFARVPYALLSSTFVDGLVMSDRLKGVLGNTRFLSPSFIQLLHTDPFRETPKATEQLMCTVLLNRTDSGRYLMTVSPEIAKKGRFEFAEQP